ncbi:hypothetical protein I203_101756 [Kwoniella mangroviensis CBS 8507]|uniref:uncharacterized protein n=1 Tax=Kwoniella mangroviensis CBS 8507 TaxID=1296122 RepID=UPI00080CD5DF|nr:uncharacterized protein I203_07323 [Kwoniella mangroviensis CBS 8507]OCF63625.1 hypothetical protein I203_07323 [Kwoniella mangroviensis CBS 8507]
MQQTQAESPQTQHLPDRDQPPKSCQFLIINFNINATETQYANCFTPEEMLPELIKLLQEFQYNGVSPASISYNTAGVCVVAHFEDEQWERIFGLTPPRHHQVESTLDRD